MSTQAPPEPQASDVAVQPALQTAADLVMPAMAFDLLDGEWEQRRSARASLVIAIVLSLLIVAYFASAALTTRNEVTTLAAELETLVDQRTQLSVELSSYVDASVSEEDIASHRDSRARAIASALGAEFDLQVLSSSLEAAGPNLLLSSLDVRTRRPGQAANDSLATFQMGGTAPNPESIIALNQALKSIEWLADTETTFSFRQEDNARDGTQFTTTGTITNDIPRTRMTAWLTALGTPDLADASAPEPETTSDEDGESGDDSNDTEDTTDE